MRGRLEGLKGRVAIGWAQDLAEPDQKLPIEILVDGVVAASGPADQFRQDLEQAGIGDGHHLFAIPIPRAFFDGRTASIAAREATSQAPLRNILSIVLDPVLGQETQIEVTRISGGKLLGYVVSPGEETDPVAITISREGQTVGEIVAGLSPAEGRHEEPPPSAQGFEVPLEPDDIRRIVSGQFLLTADEVDVSPSPGLLADLAKVSFQDIGEDLVRVSIAPDADHPWPLDFRVVRDEAVIARPSWDPRDQRASISLYVDRAAEGGRLVSVFLAEADEHVGGSPYSLSGSGPQDLVANGRFERWDGGQPSHWSLTVPDYVAVTQGYSAETQGAGLVGPTYLHFEQSAEAGSIKGTSLAQVVELPADQAELNLVVAGRSGTSTELTVILEPAERGRSFTPVRNTVALTPRFTVRALMLELPRDIAGPALLRLELTQDSARIADIALVSMGPPGYDIGERGAIGAGRTATSGDELNGEAENAVPNGRFLSWPMPFSHSLGVGYAPTADQWSVYTKRPNPNVEARLVSLTTRDVRTGETGAPSYGMHMSGKIEGPYMRAEVRLDTDALMGIDEPTLSFYAVGGQPYEGGQSPAGPDNRQIGEISLLEQTWTEDLAEPDRSKDRRILRIASRVPLGSVGQRYEFPISKDQAKVVRDLARSLRDDERKCVTLSFEWRNAVDCTLADVAIGSPPSRASTGFGPASIEDPNILAQLPALLAVSAAAMETGARAVASDRPWAWPKSYRSIDIVIPVFNAEKETMACLRSIERNTTIPHRVVMVDDASLPHVGMQLEEYAAGKPWTRLIRNAENVGYTRAANIGMSSSEADWVILLNSDTVVTPNWLEGLLETAKARPAAAMIGPVSNAASWQSVPDIQDAKGKWSTNPIPEGLAIDDIAKLVGDLSRRSFPEVPLLNGFCTLIRKDALEEVGYLDEVAFPVGYGEENDLCLRIAGAGHKLVVADHVYVYHEKSASFGTTRRDHLSAAGTKNFKTKHPNVDLAQIQRVLAEETALIELRKALRAKLGHSSDVTAAGRVA